jgi:hypothetical protein
MAIRNYNNTAPTALTSSFLDATATSVALDKVSGFPVVPFTAAIGRGTPVRGGRAGHGGQRPDRHDHARV